MAMRSPHVWPVRVPTSRPSCLSGRPPVEVEAIADQLGLELLDDVDQAAYDLFELVHSAFMDVGVVEVDGKGWLTVRV